MVLDGFRSFHVLISMLYLGFKNLTSITCNCSSCENKQFSYSCML